MDRHMISRPQTCSNIFMWNVQDAALWPMDEERRSTSPASGKADVRVWPSGERASASERGGGDGIEGLSARSSVGLRGRVGSLPYLECSAAPAMQFAGPGDELQGGSPMQTSSTVLAGVGCTSSDAVSNGRGMQDDATCCNGLQQEGRNGLIGGSASHAESRPGASNLSQQEQQHQQQCANAQLDSAEQRPEPAATAYREKPFSQPLALAAEASQHASHIPAQQDTAPDRRKAGNQSHAAAGMGSDTSVATVPPCDAPEQPSSAGTSPQHDRKRCKLRMDTACNSRWRAGAGDLSSSSLVDQGHVEPGAQRAAGRLERVAQDERLDGRGQVPEPLRPRVRRIGRRLSRSTAAGGQPL